MHALFTLFAFFLTFFAYGKQTVSLNMIVKDEAHVIRRCLDSVKPLIDYWVIVDTGSTDGTQEIIKEHMKDIPGELFERPWKNFGFNRSEALNLAKDKADYLLFMDADDWLEYEPGYTFPELSQGAYQICLTNGTFSYYKNHLVKTQLPWKWVGVLHEYVTCPVCFASPILPDLKYKLGGDGARSKDPEKYQKCALLLEEALREEPENSRYAFYLAESYRDAGNLKKAMECYQRRTEMRGWEEETFCSLLQIAKIQNALGMAKEIVIESFNRAHRFRSHRAEPIYYLAEIYNQTDRHALAYECLKGYASVPKTRRDLLFNENWIEEWGLLFQLSIASFYIGCHQESLDTCDSLLAMKDLPDSFSEQAKINREFPLEKLSIGKKDENILFPVNKIE